MHPGLSSYRPGYGLPQSVIFDVELARDVVAQSWLFVGTRADVPCVRDTFTFRLFDEEYTLVHGTDGRIRCIVNRCAHQSARLFNEITGTVGDRIVCPNHQWIYASDDGRVLRATNMPDGFTSTPEACSLGLDMVEIEEAHGLLFARIGNPVAVSEPAGPDVGELGQISEVIGPYVAPFELDGSGYKLAAHHREVVPANWLLVMVNNRECCHCRVNHRGLCQVFDPSSFNGTSSDSYRRLFADAAARWSALGLAWEEDAFRTNDSVRVARYPMLPGHASITFDGQPACERTIGPFREHDESTLSIWLNPNAWIHFTSDHIATNWVLPISADECALYTSWIVDADAVEGVDYDLDHLREVWLVTNAEDVELCTSMTAGSRSAYYRPGPFSDDEQFCTQLCDWYIERARRAQN